MKSKANIKGHPIHPILVCFPIAFYTGTLLFDILAVATHHNEYSITARYMHIAAIASALMAAVPGFIDFLYTVPPASSAKKRAARHGIINIIVLIIFIVALYLKCQENALSAIFLIMEGTGVGLTLVAGWLGGTLVYRNLIGVDQRYASAGKWKEMYIQEKTGPWEVCKTVELQLNQMKLVHINGQRIVVAKTESGWVAFSDRCTHKGGSLAGGVMICGTVHCPWHGSQFDVKTGAVKCGPSTEAIKTFQAREAEGKIYLMTE